MTKTTPLFIVAGLDSDGRPHAARFAPTEQGPAAKAAAVMGFRIGEAASGKPLAAARALPAGRIFATGKALVPYVKQELYDQLTGLVPLGTPSPVDEKADDSRFPMRRPGNDPWAEIKSGDVVLCFESAELG